MAECGYGDCCSANLIAICKNNDSVETIAAQVPVNWNAKTIIFIATGWDGIDSRQTVRDGVDNSIDVKCEAAR